MENKKSAAPIAVIALLVGVFVGWLIWGNAKSQPQMQSTNGTAHLMPDGTMMGRTSMDMATMMASMNANLSGKSGDAFDQAFITEMIKHHQGAVEMAQLALTHANHPEIKTLAIAIIKAQTSEIAQMKTWLKDWYDLNE